MLITRFMTADGVGEVLDFMPVIQDGKPTDRNRLVRRLRVARGTMHFVMDVQPRFDYGRAKHTIEPAPRPVFRGDRADRRAARQLPAGIHAPVADQRGDQPQREA